MKLVNSYSSSDELFHPFFTHNHTTQLKKNAWLDYHLFHKLNHQFKELQVIQRDEKLNPFFSPKQKALLKLLNLSLTFTSDNRPFIKTCDNQEFIQVLRDMGFFNVFCTNAGTFGVQLSQVIMFLEYGIQWVRNGFLMPGHLYNIHHLSQDVCDNRPVNLDVLPVDIHSFITSLQCGKHNIPTNLYSKDYLRTIFSKAPLTTKDGKLVKGMTQWVSRLSQVIKSTLVASTAFCITRMSRFNQCVEIPKMSDTSQLNALFGVMLELGNSVDLLSRVANFLKGKDIPSTAIIQANVKVWFKTFGAFLAESSVVSMFDKNIVKYA